MHACDPVPIVMGLRLAALRAAGAPLLIVMLRPERVVLKKVRSFTISSSMSISESLESLPSLYLSTWFSSWSPAQFGQVSSNRVSSRSWAERIANYFFPDWLLSFVHVKGKSACLYLVVACRAVLSCALFPLLRAHSLMRSWSKSSI